MAMAYCGCPSKFPLKQISKELSKCKLYKNKKYIGGGQMLTRIAYHALGMVDCLEEIPKDEVMLEVMA